MNLPEAWAAGARTLVIGVSNRGGVISPRWIPVLRTALECGFEIASGMHQKLNDAPELVAIAQALGLGLHDVRYLGQPTRVGNGVRRTGRRLLTVGTDCSCGKMYTALAIERELRSRGAAADFRATGQTGILIAGAGVSVDAVIADFMSGAIEDLTPPADARHWDIVEGQGSLFHPSYAGVSLGLLHGAQPDALVLCHEPTRSHMRGLPNYPLPDLRRCLEANLDAARLTNPQARLVGLSINTSHMDPGAALRYLDGLEREFDLPAVDPVRVGTGRIVDRILP